MGLGRARGRARAVARDARVRRDDGVRERRVREKELLVASRALRGRERERGADAALEERALVARVERVASLALALRPEEGGERREDGRRVEWNVTTTKRTNEAGRGRRGRADGRWRTARTPRAEGSTSTSTPPPTPSSGGGQRRVASSASSSPSRRKHHQKSTGAISYYGPDNISD